MVWGQGALLQMRATMPTGLLALEPQTHAGLAPLAPFAADFQSASGSLMAGSLVLLRASTWEAAQAAGPGGASCESATAFCSALEAMGSKHAAFQRRVLGEPLTLPPHSEDALLQLQDAVSTVKRRRLKSMGDYARAGKGECGGAIW